MVKPSDRISEIASKRYSAGQGNGVSLVNTDGFQSAMLDYLDLQHEKLIELRGFTKRSLADALDGAPVMVVLEGWCLQLDEWLGTWPTSEANSEPVAITPEESNDRKILNVPRGTVAIEVDGRVELWFTNEARPDLWRGVALEFVVGGKSTEFAPQAWDTVERWRFKP